MYNSYEITTQQLSEKFKLDQSTISKYLHKGNDFGWCDYNPKLNLRKGQAKTIEIMTNRKKKIYGNIIIFDENDNLIGEYISQHEAARELNKLGIKISASSIGQALKRSNHKSKKLYFYYQNEIMK